MKWRQTFASHRLALLAFWVLILLLLFVPTPGEGGKMDPLIVRALSSLGAGLHGLIHDGRMLDNKHKGSLGNSQKMVLPSNAGEVNKVRLLDAQGTNPNSAESALLTIGARVEDVPAAGFGNFQFVARIEWGTGTGRLSADIDVILGARLTVPATITTVDLIATCTAGPLAAVPTVTFDAAIGYGSAGRGLPPTLTRTWQNIPAGGTRRFILPAFAREVVPLCSAAATTVEVGMFNYTIAVPASSVAHIPIHGFVTGVGAGEPPDISIKNTSVGADNIGALFFLDL